MTSAGKMYEMRPNEGAGLQTDDWSQAFRSEKLNTDRWTKNWRRTKTERWWLKNWKLREYFWYKISSIMRDIKKVATALSTTYFECWTMLKSESVWDLSLGSFSLCGYKSYYFVLCVWFFLLCPMHPTLMNHETFQLFSTEIILCFGCIIQ
jgi:hypothetical protein